ncbi:hypothetical protein BZG01_11450 [Labilibaculum manganireducens]|uniref:DUF3592 domain-containing protein n=2 Tax=Labilibaculum manganireducens TaxID=1940525 RepID=A0A2N3I7W2_9BACT|nr:hypothetical protein BZG01_11450 [Labilibaculum manganireducens]
MMRELFIRMLQMKFIKDHWWLGVLLGFFLGMWVLPPNFLNFNRVEGTIVDVYKRETSIHVAGKGSASSMTLFIVLSDSTEYGTDVPSYQKEIIKMKPIGKRVKITYTIVQQFKNMQKLVIDNTLIIKDNILLLSLFLFCVLWVVLGGGAEIVRMWRNA